MILRGNVWKIGNDMSATDLLPARYDKEGSNQQWEECGKHVLEDIEPTFNEKKKKGDIIIAGSNLGHGHAHYHTPAVEACRHAEVGAVLADSVNIMFLRAAIDSGYPVWQFEGISSVANTGDEIEIDMRSGAVHNLTTGEKKQLTPVSEIILDILAAGSALNWTLERIGAK